MFLNFIINFSILFSFTILIFWPFIQFSEKPIIHKYKPVIVGVTFGCAALILTVLTAPYANGVLINSRSIFVLFGGLLGGPISILISGLMIVISRNVFMYTSVLSLVIMYNTLFLTLATCYIARKRPITYQNIPIYFFVLTLEHIAVLVIYNQFKLDVIYYLVMYFIVSTITFFAIRKLLMQLEHKNNQIKQIYSMRKTDLLTQLPNNIAIEQKLLSYMQANIPFELLHINLRNLREINYLHLYKVGDDVLVQVANTLNNQLPLHAHLGRLSGDEFYVLLPYAAPAEAITLAHTLNNSIQQLTFDKYPTIRPSTTIGIGSFPANAQTIHELYLLSNEALLQAKKQTSSQICHFNQITRY